MDRFLFENLSDYQRVQLAVFTDIQRDAGNYFAFIIDKFAKTFSNETVFMENPPSMASIDEQMPEDYPLKKAISNIVKLGFGGVRVVKICREVDGFDAIVLIDDDSNLMVVYPSTDNSQFDDQLYNFVPLTKYFYHDNMRHVSVINKIPKKLKNKDALAIYDSQQRQAKELIRKCADFVKLYDTKLSIYGFSLGGGIAEISAIDIADSGCRCGELILFNSYHYYEGRRKDFEKIFKAFSVKGFSLEGDPISCMYHFDAFKPYTKPIYNPDWQKRTIEYSSPTGIFVDMTKNVEVFKQFQQTKNYKRVAFIFGIKKNSETVKRMENITLFFNLHQVSHIRDHIKPSLFDKNGNTIESLVQKDGSTYVPRLYSFDEISQFIFKTEPGTDILMEIRDKLATPLRRFSIFARFYFR